MKERDCQSMAISGYSGFAFHQDGQ